MRTTLIAAVRYEFVRTRSVRSTWGLALGMCALNGLATMSIAQEFLNGSRTTALPADVLRLLTGGSLVASICGVTLLAGLLGVVIGGQDQHRGMSAATLLAVPRRGVLLCARLLVTAVWAAVATSAALVVSYAVAWQRLGSAWGFGVLGHGHVAAALASEVVLAMLTALFGLGLVGVVRRTFVAGAILLALPLVVEPAVNRMLLHDNSTMSRTALDYLPFRSAGKLVDLVSQRGGGSTLWSAPASLGGVIFLLLVAAATAAGGAFLLNRDV